MIRKAAREKDIDASIGEVLTAISIQVIIIPIVFKTKSKHINV